MVFLGFKRCKCQLLSIIFLSSDIVVTFSAMRPTKLAIKEENCFGEPTCAKCPPGSEASTELGSKL